MITYIINALQTPCPNTGFTRRLYSVQAARPQRAHGALEDPIALPQRPHSALSNTLCKRQAAAFVLSRFKINAAAWRSMRLHSVFTAFSKSFVFLLLHYDANLESYLSFVIQFKGCTCKKMRFRVMFI